MERILIHTHTHTHIYINKQNHIAIQQKLTHCKSTVIFLRAWYLDSSESVSNPSFATSWSSDLGDLGQMLHLPTLPIPHVYTGDDKSPHFLKH